MLALKRTDLAGNRQLLLNKGFGAFATARDDKNQRLRDEEVARELQESRELALQGSKLQSVLGQFI
jgi:hypothetical protein